MYLFLNNDMLILLDIIKHYCKYLKNYYSVWTCLFGSPPEAFQEGKECRRTYVFKGFS